MKGLFGLFGKSKEKNIAVVDVSSATVGAAFATISGIAPPAIVHFARAENQSETVSMPGTLRALDIVAREMEGKGAPALRAMTGRGSVDDAYVLISAPWQTTTLFVKVIENEKPFVFTKAMLSDALSEAGKDGSSPALMASVLNGYETPDPVGKKATKAEIVMLTSRIDPEMEAFVRKAVRSFVGATRIGYVTFASAAHSVLQGLFPHERDFIALRIGAEATELAFVKQSHLAGVGVAPVGTASFSKAAREHGIVSAGVVHDAAGIIDTGKSQRLAERLVGVEKEWIAAIRDALMKIAAEGALPRVIFLFADDRSLPFFKRLLDSPELHDLWLSDEPLSIIPVGPGHFHQFMRHVKEGTDDATLDMLSLISRVA